MHNAPFDPHRVFHNVKLYAFEAVSTVLFLYELWRVLDHETGIGKLIALLMGW